MHDITHYIQTYDIDLPEGFLCKLKELYEETMTHAKIGGPIGKGIVQSEVRHCFTIKIDNNELNEELYKQIDGCLRKYQEIFPEVSIQSNESGYIFLKYTNGCYYKEHIDQATNMIQRTLTIIIVLNDEYEGGELAFFHGTYVLSLKKNTLIIFPSNFIFPHQIFEITNGIRYSIVTWVY